MHYLLTIDIGTQSTRAALLTTEWNIAAVEQVMHEVDSPHVGWAQQRPDAWWEEVCWAIRSLFEKTNIQPDEIAAIASCGQMHGVVGVDRQGEVTTPEVQLWCDKRCMEQCQRIREEGDEAELLRATGSPIVPSWIAPKLIWYKENRAEWYHRAKWFLAPKDFINYRLSGVAATDPSEASGSFLWDVDRNDYSEQLAKRFDLDISKLAPSYASHTVIGHVTEHVSRTTGIISGTPVIAGGGDFPVSMLGFGVVGKGNAADVCGTSSLFAMHSPRPLFHHRVFNLRHVVDGWIPFKLLDTSGLAIEWFKDLLTPVRDNPITYDALLKMAADVSLGCDGLRFYPYLLGERRLENNTAKAAFIGLTPKHTIAHMFRAILEGTAAMMHLDQRLFAKLDLPTARLFSVGGGTRNQIWNQIKADILGTPVELHDEPEAGLKGAAVLAAAGVGLCDKPAVVAKTLQVASRIIEPNPQNQPRYREVIEEYERLYERMLGFWNHY